MLKRVTYKNCSSLNRNLRSHSAPHKCPLTISKCPLSVLWRCPSYREFGYSKMTEKRPGPAPGVRLIEVSVKRELTVYETYIFELRVTDYKIDERPWHLFTQLIKEL